MEENRSLKYIKSKDVRAYIKRTGLQFSDGEVGTLLFHSGMPYHELHCALKELAEGQPIRSCAGRLRSGLPMMNGARRYSGPMTGVSFSQ